MTQFDVNEAIGGTVSVLLLVLPYSLLFTKKGGTSLSEKLLFINITELIVLILGVTAAFIFQSPALIAFLFPFSIYVELVVIGNLVFMACIWLMKKVKPKKAS
jgi:predicted membrane-bound spermidine synthase